MKKYTKIKAPNKYKILIYSISYIFILITFIPVNSFSQDSLHYSHYKYNRLKRMAENINLYTNELYYRQKIKKLENALKTCTDTVNDEYYNLLSKYVLLLSEKDYRKAVDIVNTKLKLINNSDKQYIKLLSDLANIHKKNKNYVKELETYEQLIILNNKNKTWNDKAWDEVIVGNIYFNGEFFLRAIYYYKLAINDFNKVNKRNQEVGLAVCYQNIGMSEDRLGNHNKAKENFNKAIKYRRDTGNFVELADLYIFIGDNFVSELSYDSAIVYYSNSINIDKKNGRYNHLILSYLRLADLKYKQCDISSSINYNRIAYNYSKKIGNFEGITKSTSSLGGQFLMLNMLDSAIKYCVTSTAFASEIDDYSAIKKNAIRIINALQDKEAVSINEILLYEKLINKADSAIAAQNISRNELMKEIIKRNNNAIIDLAKQSLYIKAFYISVGVSVIFLFLIIVIIINRNKIKEQKERQYLTLKQVRELNNDLEELSAHQERTYSVVGHDLKGSLGSSLSLLEILNSEELNKEDTNYYMNLVTHAVNNTYNMMLDLLDWTRVISDRIDFSPHKIDLNSVVNDALFFINKSYKNKSIGISINFKSQCIVYADKVMLDAIVRNLLNNAIKFTPRNGKIDICISIVDNKTSLKIKDNGVGMDEKQLSTLFDKNSFNSRVGTEKEKGSGLGLKLVYKFVRRNNADIKVESKLGEGTTFTILFPKIV